MRKTLLVLCLIALALGSMLFLTACDKLIALLNGETGTQSEGDPPTIAGIETIKAYDGYLESEEYLYNSQGTNPMALDFSEEYYLVIHYNNPSKKTINTVKVSWREESKPQPSSQEFKSDSFGPGSNELVTYIPFATGDQTELRAGEIVYTVTGVFYTDGMKSEKAKFAENVKNNISVAVRPNKKLTLMYMNADLRRGIEKKEGEWRRYESVYYKTEMRNFIASPNFDGEGLLPTKQGGWVFSGWYTEPLGKGRLIKDTDKFDVVRQLRTDVRYRNETARK